MLNDGGGISAKGKQLTIARLDEAAFGRPVRAHYVVVELLEESVNFVALEHAAGRTSKRLLRPKA